MVANMFVGGCLGAQLIAHVLSARLSRPSEKIVWEPNASMTLTLSGDPSRCFDTVQA
jgi:GMP synthase-like glutamine amidotransferase